MTAAQVDMFLAQIPRLLYMQHYPLASAMAHWANAQGGKKKGKGAKEIPDHLLFKPEEFLFHMAKYQPYLEEPDKPKGESMGIDRETARLILKLNTHEIEGKRKSLLEPWIIGALPWDEVLALGEG